MKLINFTTEKDEKEHFGVVVGGNAVPFATLQQVFDEGSETLDTVDAYLNGLPASHSTALKLLQMARERHAEVSEAETYELDSVKLRPPVPSPPALLDFALAPEHVRNSALTLIKYEKSWPARSLMSRFVKSQYAKRSEEPSFICYKGNHNSVIGDMDSTLWPSFSSYLDVEAELGVVVGKAPLHMPSQDVDQAIAGYVIFNDFSARDVQWPEVEGRLGMARCKDFERSNGLGPFLVTPDEIPDPLALNVRVKAGARIDWTGNTSAYVAHPARVIEWLTRYQTVLPGTIIGMGTVPWCCGLDRDEWILPGDLVEITFDGLGTLRQPIPSEIGPLEPSRWPARPELEPFARKTG